MPAKNATTESGGFTAAERAAMKKRAAELRAEGKKGAKKADGLQAVNPAPRCYSVHKSLAGCVRATASPGITR